MENRFTFKDFVYMFLLLGIGGLVVFSIAQMNHQEQRTTDLMKWALSSVNENHQKEIEVLQKLQTQGIKITMAGGGMPMMPATTNGGTVVASGAKYANNMEAPKGGREQPGAVRYKGADGTLYFYFPNAPVSPTDPRDGATYSRGDWLVENMGAEPSKINPYVSSDANASIVQGHVLESLITRDPVTFEIQPFLAESYEQKPDGLTFVFVLRKEAKWSDGEPVTADDVVFSFETIMNKDVDCAPEKSYYGQIESVKKLDARTVQFKFSEPYFESLSLAGGMSLIPKHVYAFKNGSDFNDWRDKLVGSGPYKMDTWVKGGQMVLVRNQNYWGERPTFDKIVYKFILNPTAACNDFMVSKLDTISPTPDQWKKYAEVPDAPYKVFKFPTINSGYRYIGYNLRKPMFADKLTRQAMTMLLDREGMIKAFEPELAITTTGPFNPMSKQYDHSIQPWPYDVAGAIKKLEEAGWKKNDHGYMEREGKEFKFDLMIPANSPTAERVATYCKSQWSKAGIEMNVMTFEFGVMIDRINERNFDAMMLGWTGGIEGDPFQIWDSKSIPDKGSNAVGFDNKEADALIEKGRRELDEAKRMEIWHKFHQIVHEEQPYTFLTVSFNREFVNGRFDNVKPLPTGLNEDDWFVPAGKQMYKN